MYKILLVALCSFAVVGLVCADDHDPRQHRQELMKSVGKAAKPMGEMLRGKRAYDAEVVLESLGTFDEVSAKFGDLFPAGTETGMETEAAPAIWEDREGFDRAIAKWAEDTDTAIAAAPATLEAAKPVLGQVFQNCKNCHETYRLEDE